MLLWKDIGITKSVENYDKKVQEFAEKYARRISQLQSGTKSFDGSSFIDSVIARYNHFCQETNFVLVWSDVPREKQRGDWEQQMRGFYYGYNKPFYMTVEQIDENLDTIGEIKKLEKDKSMSFFHSLETATTFAEEQKCTQDEAAKFLSVLLEGQVLYDPLYLRDILNHPERMNFKGRENIEQFAAAISSNYREQRSVDSTMRYGAIFRLDDEAMIAQQFFQTKPERVEFPKKFVIHTSDGQASEKIWRTYLQVAERTASKLASMITYGIVTGGVVGGIVPTITHGTIDRADLCMMNWYPQYQGAVLVPLDSFARPDFECHFMHSRSVMIDGERGTGIDIYIGPNEHGVLPYVNPSHFVTVISVELLDRVSDEIHRLGHLLKRPEEEMNATLNRCIGYDPSHWKNFHYFNEWLQSTPEGNSLLEEKLGRNLSKLKSVSEIKTRL